MPLQLIGNVPATLIFLHTPQVHDTWRVMGLTPREGVALAARLRSSSYQQALGYSGCWSGTSRWALACAYMMLISCLEPPIAL